MCVHAPDGRGRADGLEVGEDAVWRPSWRNIEEFMERRARVGLVSARTERGQC